MTKIFACHFGIAGQNPQEILVHRKHCRRIGFEFNKQVHDAKFDKSMHQNDSLTSSLKLLS